MVQNSQQDELFAKQMTIKRHIKKIAITQTVLSVLCIILGIVGTVLLYQHNTYQLYIYQENMYRYNLSYGYYSSSTYFIPSTATGIWSSVLTFIAGGLGIGVGSPRSGEGMIIAHMVFAILGCVSEFLGIIFSAIVSAHASFGNNGSVMAIYIILCILSFISFSLLVTTSAFCCKLLKCCCGSATDSGYQVAYAPQTMVQTPHGMMMMQQPQGTVMMQQPQGTVMMYQPQGFVPQYSQPQANPQDTNNLINSEETVQPLELKITPSYS